MRTSKGTCGQPDEAFVGMILHTVTSSAVTRALERQSPSGTGSCRSQERHAGASVRSIESSSVAISRTRRVMLSLIVDESDWARARIAIMRSGRSDVEILRVAYSENIEFARPHRPRVCSPRRNHVSYHAFAQRSGVRSSHAHSSACREHLSSGRQELVWDPAKRPAHFSSVGLRLSGVTAS